MDTKEIKASDANTYKSAVDVIKAAILKSQQKACKAVNQEQLALYYGIGRYVSENSRKGFWGTDAIATISTQLRKELPGLRGFSERNIKNMRTFYEEWNVIEVGDSAVATAEKELVEYNSAVVTAELPHVTPMQGIVASDFPTMEFLSIGFTCHCSILTKVKDVEQRKFYIQLAAERRLKVDDLEQAIDQDVYSHRANIPNNFTKTIPDTLQAYRSIQMFKDEYLLDFINVEELFVRDKDRDEKFVENEIMHNIKNFIMTFGRDFTFVGNQYHLEKYGHVEFPDLLFFNRELNALVVVELKDTEFRTSYLGQLCGYLRILDDTVKKPHENPSIGIILCSKADKKFAEYVLQDYSRPMGVATFKTSADMDENMKKVLPSIEDLTKLLEK